MPNYPTVRPMKNTDNYQSIIDQTVAFVKSILTNAEGGHDWWHILRVWKFFREWEGEI